MKTRPAFSRAERLESRIAPATIVVTNTSANGNGSLYAAINQANGQAGADKIVFQNGVHGQISLYGNLPKITDSLTISAPGSEKLVINGDGHAIFDIEGSGLNVTLSGLTLTKGSAKDGGAIYINDPGGKVTISKAVITGNVAAGQASTGYYSYTVNGRGGGIAIQAGSLTVKSSVISGNETHFGGGIFDDGQGGGIFVSYYASANISKSTISGNSASTGGGIFSAGTLTLTKSTVSGNSATGGIGGGIFTSGTTHVTSSVIADNTATGSYYGGPSVGGGIAVMSEGNLIVSKSKITGNTVKAINGMNGSDGAYYGANGYYGSSGKDALGGGIYGSYYSHINVSHSTISNNTVTAGNGGNGGNGFIGADSTDEGVQGGQGGNGGNGGNGGLADGAGIATHGILKLQSSKITGNIAISGHGGKGGNGANGGKGGYGTYGFYQNYTYYPGTPAGAGGYGGNGGIGGSASYGAGAGVSDFRTPAHNINVGNVLVSGVSGQSGSSGFQGYSGDYIS